MDPASPPGASPRTRDDALSDVVIRTLRLTKFFGPQAAVRELTFDVSGGTIFGFIGPSGCGKTTTIRLLTGVYQPSAGEALVFGRPPSRFPMELRERIGYMQRGPLVPPAGPHAGHRRRPVRRGLGGAATEVGHPVARHRARLPAARSRR